MSVRALLRLQRRAHQLALRGLGVVLAVVALWVFLSLGMLRSLLDAVFNRADLQILLSLSLTLLLLLIPISGIYSLLSQYAYWEGWLDGLPQLEPTPGPPEPAHAPNLRRFVVYLDGIHQVERDHPPRVKNLLAQVEEGLDSSTVLLRGLDSYTVQPVKLAEDRGSAWFWQRLFALQEEHPNGVVRFCSSFLVEANNVIKVGISSDRRYGPIANYLLAVKILRQLQQAGFAIDQGQEVVLMGYSGGGEMAMGAAEYLHQLTRSPIRILTFCGVFSGNQPLQNVDDIAMVVGSADPVAALGTIIYPGRLPWLPLSNWNKARRRGQVQRVCMEGLNHNGEDGPFSEQFSVQVAQRLLHLLGPSRIETAA